MRDALALLPTKISGSTELSLVLERSTPSGANDSRGPSAARRANTPAPEASLTLTFKKKRITQEHHDYELVVVLKNLARRRIDDWEIEIEFPTPLLDGVVHTIRVDDRSNGRSTLFRLVGSEIGRALRPDDEQPVRLGYFIDKDIFWRRKELFDEIVRARAMVDGEIIEEVERPVRELQDF
jgi:hypothetical protein